MNCSSPFWSKNTRPEAEDKASVYALLKDIGGPEFVTQMPSERVADVTEYAVKTLYAVGD